MSPAIGNEPGEPLSRRMTPANAERVSRRIGVDLMTLRSIQIGR